MSKVGETDMRFSAPPLHEEPKTFGFDTALQLLKDGESVERLGWNGKNQWVKAQFPDKNSKMGAPYLYLSNAQGVLVPWVPSQGDLFAEDWILVYPGLTLGDE